MGYGDEIMVTGQVKSLGRKHVILDRHGQPRWHPLWQGNKLIATPDEARRTANLPFIVNGSGCRPYVDYTRTTKQRWFYTDWRCAPGALPIGRKTGGAYVVIEPHIKHRASPNKQWGWDRWQALADALRGYDLVQLCPAGACALAGIRRVNTPSFLDACGWLSGAAAAVLPEGGLHHAAAALDIPAVVIFGSMTSPANTGYDTHVNVYRPHLEEGPCGLRVPCADCQKVMAGIEPADVARQFRQLLNRQDSAA